MQMGQRGATMNIGQLDGQPLALQIFNGMTAESTCVNERWAKDQLFRCVSFAGGQIKSTPSIAWRTLCFNLRPPCGGRQFFNTSRRVIYSISIRVLRVEDDQFRMYQPQNVPISIPVLRVEDDKVALKIWRCRLHFNPRPPCGGRRLEIKTTSELNLFQSTSSVWRTTFR